MGGNRLAGPDIRTESDRGSQRVIECIFRCNRCKTSVRTRHDDTRDKVTSRTATIEDIIRNTHKKESET